MKVTFGQVTLILLHLFLLSTANCSQRGGDYATLSSIRRQPIPETNAKQETLKFGAKISKPVNDVNKFQRTATAVITTPTTQTTYAARTYNNNKQNHTSQRYEIPVIYKNHTITAVQNKQPRRGSNFFIRSANNVQSKPTRSSGFATTRLKAGYSKSRSNAIAKPTTLTTTTTTTTTAKTTTTSTTPTTRKF